MRKRAVQFLLVLLALTGCLTLSLIRGQDRPAAPPLTQPAPLSAPPGAPAAPARDLSRLTPLQRQMLLSAQCGADWLYRMNGVKGRFLYGYLPALEAEMEGDQLLRQAGAA